MPAIPLLSACFVVGFDTGVSDPLDCGGPPSLACLSRMMTSTVQAHPSV
jgi:hypothetical protein